MVKITTQSNKVNWFLIRAFVENKLKEKQKVAVGMVVVVEEEEDQCEYAAGDDVVTQETI